jgi:hypothetical protein
LHVPYISLQAIAEHVAHGVEHLLMQACGTVAIQWQMKWVVDTASAGGQLLLASTAVSVRPFAKHSAIFL